MEFMMKVLSLAALALPVLAAASGDGWEVTLQWCGTHIEESTAHIAQKGATTDGASPLAVVCTATVATPAGTKDALYFKHENHLAEVMLFDQVTEHPETRQPRSFPTKLVGKTRATGKSVWQKGKIVAETETAYVTYQMTPIMEWAIQRIETPMAEIVTDFVKPEEIPGLLPLK